MPLSAEQRRTLVEGVEVVAEGRTVSALEARRDELLRELYRLKIAAPTDS
jgi:hypothetical protein